VARPHRAGAAHLRKEMGMEVLRLTDVSKTFRGRAVLDRVTLSLDEGSVVGLIGDNGAGKTTLLRLAAGLLAPSSGEVSLFGHTDVVSARRQLGTLLERPGHYDELTVEENLLFFYDFYGQSPARVKWAVREGLDRSGLSPMASERVGRLSTGMRQRLALARALHPWARLLLLDEPFESLDPVARHQLKERLRDAARDGLTVMISSHTLQDLSDLSDRLLLVADRRLRAFDSFTAMSRELGLTDSSDLDALYAAYRQYASHRGVH
jgi:ABC-2 type transport system ATP-binding protein